MIWLGMMPFQAWRSEFVVMNKCQHVTWNKCLLPHVSPFLLLFIGKGTNMAVPQTAQIWSEQVLLLNNQASMFHTKPANGNYICTFSGQLVSSLGISSNGTQNTDYLTLRVKLLSNVWPFARAQQHYLWTSYIQCGAHTIDWERITIHSPGLCRFWDTRFMDFQ